MEHKPPILASHFYHIFNRGNNKWQIFFSDEDYSHFIELMKIFLLPIADVYSYALMINHFHIALRIKTEDEIGWLDPRSAACIDLTLKWRTSFDDSLKRNPLARKPSPERMIQHLFSTYSIWLNKRYKRTGNLMEDRFERKVALSEDHLRTLICYVNANPEKHGVQSFYEYQWTSYQELVGDKPVWLARDSVIELFGDVETFKLAMKKVDFDDWLNT
jgi:hypothetical protein